MSHFHSWIDKTDLADWLSKAGVQSDGTEANRSPTEDSPSWATPRVPGHESRQGTMSMPRDQPGAEQPASTGDSAGSARSGGSGGASDWRTDEVTTRVSEKVRLNTLNQSRIPLPTGARATSARYAVREHKPARPEASRDVRYYPNADGSSRAQAREASVEMPQSGMAPKPDFEGAQPASSARQRKNDPSDFHEVDTKVYRTRRTLDTAIQLSATTTAENRSLRDTREVHPVDALSERARPLGQRTTSETPPVSDAESPSVHKIPTAETEPVPRIGMIVRDAVESHENPFKRVGTSLMRTRLAPDEERQDPGRDPAPSADASTAESQPAVTTPGSTTAPEAELAGDELGPQAQPSETSNTAQAAPKTKPTERSETDQVRPRSEPADPEAEPNRVPDLSDAPSMSLEKRLDQFVRWLAKKTGSRATFVADANGLPLALHNSNETDAALSALIQSALAPVRLALNDSANRSAALELAGGGYLHITWLASASETLAVGLIAPKVMGERLAYAVRKSLAKLLEEAAGGSNE